METYQFEKVHINSRQKHLEHDERLMLNVKSKERNKEFKKYETTKK